MGFQNIIYACFYNAPDQRLIFEYWKIHNLHFMYIFVYTSKYIELTTINIYAYIVQYGRCVHFVYVFLKISFVFRKILPLISFPNSLRHCIVSSKNLAYCCVFRVPVKWSHHPIPHFEWLFSIAFVDFIHILIPSFSSFYDDSIAE